MRILAVFHFFIFVKCGTLHGFRVDEGYHDFLNCSCGRYAFEKVFIDGVAISPAEFPWLIGILRGNGVDTSTKDPLCYGALISDRHVLTAASCLRKKKRNQISAYFYGKNIKSRRRRTISRITVHGAYSEENHDNNLALLTLAIPLNLLKREEMIAPVCIPNPELFKTRVDSKLKGIMIKKQYYKTALVGSPRYYFAWIFTKIEGIRNASCSNVYTERTRDKVLCSDGQHTSCYGDEGSPLAITLSESGQTPLLPEKGGRYYALGVYSRGYGCNGYQKGKSGVDVSTNILTQTNWLIRNTRDGYFCS